MEEGFFFFLSELETRAGNPAHICANLPEVRREQALEISPSLEAAPPRWGGLSRGGGFFQRQAPHIMLGWDAQGVGAVVKDGGSCWEEIMRGHGSARGWTEWRNGDERSNGTVLVAVGAVGMSKVTSTHGPRLLYWSSRHIAHVPISDTGVVVGHGMEEPSSPQSSLGHHSFKK